MRDFRKNFRSPVLFAGGLRLPGQSTLQKRDSARNKFRSPGRTGGYHGKRVGSEIRRQFLARPPQRCAAAASGRLRRYAGLQGEPQSCCRLAWSEGYRLFARSEFYKCMNILDDIVQSQFESRELAGRVSSWQTGVRLGICLKVRAPRPLSSGHETLLNLRQLSLRSRNLFKLL